MEHRHVPGWLAALVACAGIALACSIGAGIFHYLNRSIAKNELGKLNAELVHLRQHSQQLKDKIPQMEALLEDAKDKLRGIKKNNSEERDSVRSSLLPQITEAVADAQLQRDKMRNDFKTLLNNANQTRQELGAEEEQAQSQQRKFEADIRKLREKILTLTHELELTRKKHRNERSFAQREIDRLEERVQELLDRRDIRTEDLTSDGQVLNVMAHEGFVVINRGINHDLRPGTKFTVYNRRGGTNTVKGKVEITEIKQGIAVARILEEKDQNDPLIPGDHLHNPVYNPDDVKVFVIKGDFETYSHDELKHFITDAENVVEPDISRKTDFLVAGFNAEDSIQIAADNGVTIISEKQLLEFIRREKRSVSTQGLTFVVAGEFTEVNPQYALDFVKQSGGTLAEAVDENTQVLIAGEGANDAIAAARAAGALIISQRELLQIMGH